jgi:hypothetical protein
MTMLAVEYYNAQDCVGSNFTEILSRGKFETGAIRGW